MKKAKKFVFGNEAFCYLLLLFLFCQCDSKLPKKPADQPNLTWSKKEEGWPPKLANMDVKEFVLQRDPERLTPTMLADTRSFVLQNSRVKALIGSRFAVTAIAEPEPTKGGSLSEKVSDLNVYIYSYTFNRPLLVKLKNNEIVQTDTLSRIVLSESLEEIQAAITLAKTDPTVKARSTNLEANASLTFPEKGKEGYGNRLFFVTFSEKNNRLPQFSTVVDLTLNKIIK